jgi:hypothetical protein
VIAHHKLIAGLPPDVPETLCHLLRVLDVIEEPTVESPSPSTPALAKILHASEMSVRRAVEVGTASGVLEIADVFNQAGKVFRVLRHPNSPTESDGKLIGRLIIPNWIKITELQNTSVFTVNTLNGNQRVQGEQAARVSNWCLEGKGKEMGFEHPPILPHASDAVLILTWRQLHKRYREAQQTRGIPEHKQTTIVHGQRDKFNLKEMIQRTPPKGIWTPYMRVVNLFSFWIERHPLKNLKFPISAFKENFADWTQALYDWEATATEEFRVILSAPDEPEVENEPQTSGQSKAGIEAAAYLHKSLGWVPDSAPKTLSRLLQTFKFEEIVAQFETDRATDGFCPPDTVAAKFAKGGALLEVGIRCGRNKLDDSRDDSAKVKKEKLSSTPEHLQQPASEVSPAPAPTVAEVSEPEPGAESKPAPIRVSSKMTQAEMVELFKRQSVGVKS